MSAERQTSALDVSHLPTTAFGYRNVSWLGNVLYMIIEGTMFLIVMVTYFYLRTRSPHWPPSGFIPPSLSFGLASAALFLVSLIPARWIKMQAFRESRAKVRVGLGVLATLALVLLVIRWLEFTALNCRWTDNAYASCLWVLLGIHTGHLITEWIETLAVFSIATTAHMHGIRFADAAMNSDYWYFVTASALLVDLLIYGTTRWM